MTKLGTIDQRFTLQLSSDTMLVSSTGLRPADGFWIRGKRVGRGIDMIGGTNIMGKMFSKGSMSDERHWKKESR